MDINASVIKQHRTQKNWTQQHLADACGISLRTVQRVERYGNASNETVSALAAVFEIDQEEIVVNETPKDSHENGDTSNPWIERIFLMSVSVAVGYGIASFIN